MTPAQIKKCARAVEAVERARAHFDLLRNQEVLSLELAHGVRLSPYASGTGWAADVGYPKDLAYTMTTALREWARDKLENAISDAAELGIEFEKHEIEPVKIELAKAGEAAT